MVVLYLYAVLIKKRLLLASVLFFPPASGKNTVKTKSEWQLSSGESLGLPMVFTLGLVGLSDRGMHLYLLTQVELYIEKEGVVD